MSIQTIYGKNLGADNMSYRTWITNQDGLNYQLLGNNECYQPLIEYLKFEGCEVCADNIFENFEITNLPKVLTHLQEYLKEKNTAVKEIKLYPM